MKCDFVNRNYGSLVQRRPPLVPLRSFTVKLRSGTSGGATPGRARSNDLAGRSTALA